MINYFENLEKIGYDQYLKANPFYLDLLEEFPSEFGKSLKSPYESVDIHRKTQFPSEYDDLIRLHYLIRQRKVTTILEFGVGRSTIVFNHALENNKKNFNDFVEANLRRSNPFECHSIDNNIFWINKVRETYRNLHHVSFHCFDVKMTIINNRICTLYNNLPNVCPDFIYLDGPDQFSVQGDVNGIHSRHPDRLPMAADLLLIEYYLLPGTLIVIDGRTANARFLLNNLQRKWEYTWLEEYDQHFFELVEEPLGIYNKKQLSFSLKKK